MLSKHLRHDLQDGSMMRKVQAILHGWHQLVLHKHEAEAVLLGYCLEAWAAMARRAGLLRFLLIEHAAIRQVRLLIVTAQSSLDSQWSHRLAKYADLCHLLPFRVDRKELSLMSGVSCCSAAGQQWLFMRLRAMIQKR